MNRLVSSDSDKWHQQRAAGHRWLLRNNPSLHVREAISARRKAVVGLIVPITHNDISTVSELLKGRCIAFTVINNVSSAFKNRRFCPHFFTGCDRHYRRIHNVHRLTICVYGYACFRELYELAPLAIDNRFSGFQARLPMGLMI